MRRDYILTDSLINTYFEAVPGTDGSPLGLIVPRDAGNQTNALLAAGLKQMERQLYDLVVLVGVSTDRGLLLQAKGRLSTPLGELEIDQAAGESLAKGMPDFKPLKLNREKRSAVCEALFGNLAAFLKFVAPYTKVLPVMLPANDLETAARLGEILHGLLNEKPAVVIAQASLDPPLLAALEYNDPEIFKQTIMLDQGVSGTELEGKDAAPAPAAVVLGYAHACGGNTVSVLQQTSHGALSHAAVMFWDYQPPRLSKQQEAELLKAAVRAIESYVSAGVILETSSADPELNRKAGVFVTLRIQGMLRGCIGHMIAEKPLIQSVQEMAVAAATSDPRFPPLSRKEIAQISIKVAVLSPMQRISYEQVQVGKHGLLISYGGRRGVLLPEVPAERGWDRETFLENLCYKAGLPGDTWRLNPTLYAFTSVVFGSE